MLNQLKTETQFMNYQSKTHKRLFEIGWLNKHTFDYYERPSSKEIKFDAGLDKYEEIRRTKKVDRAYLNKFLDYDRKTAEIDEEKNRKRLNDKRYLMMKGKLKK